MARKGREGKVVVQSIERALRILSLFRAEPALGLTDIARAMGLAKSTTYGLLATLENGNILEQDLSSGKYRLGIALLELGGLFSERLDLRREAEPIMRELVEKFSETVQLSVLEGREVVYVERVEAPTSLKLNTYIGMRAPATCTATGKMLLSSLPDRALDVLLKAGPLPAKTARSIVGMKPLKVQLKKIREQGYSVDNEESEIGLRGVAAGVHDRVGRMVAAMSLGGPTTRVTPEVLPDFIRAIQGGAAAISARLGYRGTSLL